MIKIDPIALEKRVKRHVRAKHQQFYAVVPPGFEETACRELTDCGISAALEDRGGMTFSGTWEECWRAHHRARIPARILVRLTHFTCTRFDRLERQIEAFPWELWLQPRQSVAFQVESHQSALYHQGAIQERAERCIERRLRPWQAISPEIDPGYGAQTVYIRNVRNRMTISLDCSGELLYKRGYDKHVAAAPLRDNIAAAILREAKFSEFDTLVDPMAGSGTFGLEALLGLAECGAGHLRHFAFEHFPAFRPAAYRYFLKTDADSRPGQAKLRTIALRESHERPLTIIRHNLQQLKAAGVDTKQVHVEQADFFTTSAESIPGKILITTNPPYGTRLKGTQNTRAFFGKLGQHLRQHWQGCSFAVIAPGKASERALALPVARKVIFSNGGISAALLMGTIRKR
jgi:putative N6-adenine-specific DNA methylase